MATSLTAAELMRRAAMRWDHGDMAGAKEDWHRAGNLAAFHQCCPTRRRLEAIESAVIGGRMVEKAQG